MSAGGFVHLHVHSCYSLLRGGSSLASLIDGAKRLGMPALALTDTNGMYGTIPFYKGCLEAGIRPILGVEIHCGRDARVVALARNAEGYRSLCRLTTARQLDEDFDLVEACALHHEGLYLLTPHGALLHALAGRVPREALRADLVPRFGLEQRRELLHLRDVANELGVRCVVTNDVFFTDATDFIVHQALRAIDAIVSTEQLDAEQHDVADADAWLTSAVEIANAVSTIDLSDAFAETRSVADACCVELELDTPRFPRVPLPPGETAQEVLRRICEKGLKDRYSQSPSPEAWKRLDEELAVINDHGFNEYFLAVYDIVGFAKGKEIPYVGRGSAADSIVTYALGISSVDPIHYDLCFARFLNSGRADYPDIDIDFCWRGRDDVLEYVYKTYGRDHVAMICTFNTYSARSAFRDVAKTFGVSQETVDYMSTRLPRMDAKNIAKAAHFFPECRTLPLMEEPYWSILQIAARIDGFPRHLGIHPCGIVISPEPLTDLVPLEYTTKGLVVTQYDMDPVEAMGLVKIDLLGQRALSIVADAERIIQTYYDRTFSLKRETETGDDEAVAEFAQRGDTLGCFQIDSPGMRNLLKQIRAKTRLDLIAALSLIRPGPASSGMKDAYIRRVQGLEPVPVVHPTVDALLADTHGVLLYQEDLLQVAHHLAGFSYDEADRLRKEMSRWKQSNAMVGLSTWFLEGCAKNNVPSEAATEVWLRMCNFAGYSYCKAHACTYGHISYEGVWLKAYYPAAFCAAVLNNDAGMYAARVHVEDARRHGVAVLPVDIHMSDERSTVEEGMPGSENRRWHRVKEPPAAVRLGLQHIRGVSAATIQAVLAARPFTDIRDLCRRVPIDRDEICALIQCGACDRFPMTRPQMLWEVAQAFGPIHASKLAEQPLFPGDVFDDHLPPVPPLPEYGAIQKLIYEQDILGLELTGHPLEPFDALLEPYNAVPAERLHDYAGQQVHVAGFRVAGRRILTNGGKTKQPFTVDEDTGMRNSPTAVTEHQKYMRFLTLEDRTGLTEVVLFPDVYQRYGHLVDGPGPYVIRGVVDDNFGACTVTAESLIVLDEVFMNRIGARYASPAVQSFR